ncbi:TolC family protein [Gilvibacter sp.]|uniref:TolC family protein n=1 Tax=Gilvibacter sp. TaxID=2729997 RepID=UPI0025C34DDF|nr:TolC family protein [Gilvibacter sp.]NQX76317.1 TolC family protein [Gilvibacter sp.]
MKIKITQVLTVSLICGVFLQAFGQVENTTAPSSEFDFILPKVELFIEAAHARSGMLNYQKLDIEVLETDVKTQSRIWSQNMGVRGDLRYGTFNNFISSTTGAENTNIATLSQQLNYGIGLYLQLPIFDVWNRKNQVKRAKLEVEQAYSLVEEQKQVIEQEVIRMYEAVVLRYELLKVQSTNYGNSRVNMEMVEKEFRNGNIIAYEYVRLNDIAARIQSDYETAKSNFLLAKRLLENYTGLKIAQ